MIPFQLSKEARAVLKAKEALRLSAYDDGTGTWTIGWGHTDGVKKGDKITVEQAEDFLIEDLKSREVLVNGVVQVPISQYQFDALVLFAFNVGNSAFKNSTLLKELNAGRTASALNEFDKWVFITERKGFFPRKKKLEGLVKRREAEKTLFIMGMA